MLPVHCKIQENLVGVFELTPPPPPHLIIGVATNRSCNNEPGMISNDIDGKSYKRVQLCTGVTSIRDEVLVFTTLSSIVHSISLTSNSQLFATI